MQIFFFWRNEGKVLKYEIITRFLSEYFILNFFLARLY